MSMFAIKKFILKKATILGIVVATAAVMAGVSIASSMADSTPPTTTPTITASTPTTTTAADTAPTNPCGTGNGNQDSNAVIYGGVDSISQLECDYNSNVQGVKSVYASQPFFIGSGPMQDFLSNYQVGYVYAQATANYPANSVVVNGKVVGTDAMTAGRDSASCDPNIQGEEPNNTGVYVRPPTCSFLESPLKVYAYMPNGVFRFGVLASCGNPVIATPPTTPPPPPPPAPIAQCVNLTEETIGQADPNGDQEYQLTATAYAKNATINDYKFNFLDGTTMDVVNNAGTYRGNYTYTDTVDHTYRPGDHSALVDIDFTGDSSQPLSDSCRASFTVPLPPTPNYTIVKGVKVYNTNTPFVSSITVNPGTDVEYRLDIHSTGKATVDHLVVKDKMPSDDTYVSGTLTVNGETMPDSAASALFGGGLDVGNVAAGQEVVIRYEALAGENDKTGKCVAETLNNTGTMKATSLPSKSSSATVKVVCVPIPKSPNYTILKTVAVKGSDNFTSDVEINPGDTVVYKIVVKSIGTAPVTNLDVKDTLPTDAVYTAGTMTLNGKKVTSKEAKAFFGGGVTFTSLAPGATETFKFSAVDGSNENNANCINEIIPNTGIMTATKLPQEQSSANASVSCIPVTPGPVTPTPATPGVTSLTNTGPGNDFAVMGAATALGTIGHYIYRARKFGRSLF